MWKSFRKSVLLLIIQLPFGASYGQNCNVNVGHAAGSILDHCEFETLRLDGGSDNTNLQGIPTWSQVAGPTVTIVDPQQLDTEVTGLENAVGEVITFRLSALCTDNETASQEISYNILPSTTPVIDGMSTIEDAVNVFAIADNYELCPGTYNLFANSPSAQETGVWLIGGDNNYADLHSTIRSSISDLNDPNATITIPEESAGPFTLTWRMYTTIGLSCIQSTTINLVALGGESVVDAGADKTLGACYLSSQTTTLTGSFGGFMDSQSGEWTTVSGPSLPVLTHSVERPEVVTVTEMVEGSYVFRWTVAGNCVNGSDEVMVTVPEATQEVTSAQTYSLNFCDGRTSATVFGNAPELAGEYVEWTTYDVPNPITFDDPNSPITTVSGLDGISDYELEYRIYSADASCFDLVRMNITFTDSPTIQVDGLSGSSVVDGVVVLDCGVTFTSGIPYSATGGDRVELKIIDAPDGYPIPADYSEPDDGFKALSQFRLTGLTYPGEYIVRVRNFSVNTECPVVSEDIKVIVSRDVASANAGSDLFLDCDLINPTITATLEGNAPLASNGVPAYGLWSLVSVPEGVDFDDVTIVDPTNENTEVNGLVSGEYEFQWTISAGNECAGSSSVSKVTVTQSGVSLGVDAAGEDEVICYDSPYILQGDPIESNESLIWSVTSNPVENAANVNFSDPSDPNAVVTGLQANTVYTFTYTVSNYCTPGGVTDQVEITTNSSQGGDAAHAGIDQCLIHGTTSTNLAGNDPSIGTGTWTQESGPNTATITDENLFNTTISSLIEGTYVFRWTIQEAGCHASIDEVVIVIDDANGITQADAGVEQEVCGSTANLIGNSVDTGEIGTWAQTSGPGGASIANANSNATTVSDLVEGVYEFTWTIENSVCFSSSASVSVIVGEEADVAMTAGNIIECVTNAVTLNATPVTKGYGIWSLEGSAPNNPTFDDITKPDAIVSELIAGTYTFRWTTYNTHFCSQNSSDVTVTISETPDAGDDQQLCNETTTFLEGNPGSIGTWTQDLSDSHTAITITPNGTNGAIVSNMISNQTYNFTYTIDDNGTGCGQRADNVQVINSGFGTQPNAGMDASYCLSNLTGNSFSLSANGSIGDGVWTRSTTSPTGGSFENNIDPNSDFNNPEVGVYIFNWTVTNDNCEISDVVVVRIEEDPSQADAGEDQIICVDDLLTLAAVEPLVGQGTWSIISKPTAGTPDPIFSSQLVANPEVSNLEVGNYIFAWIVTSGSECVQYLDHVGVAVHDPVAPTGSTQQTFCQENNHTVSDLIVSGDDIIWYDASSGGNIIQSNTALSNGTTYYASQTTAGCESESRLAVTVTLTTTSTPTGTTIQTFCQSDSPTLANLAVSGSDLQWYDVPSDGNSLANGTVLVDGATYYASQTVDGCESSSRLAVTVSLTTTPAPTGSVTQTFCESDNPTLTQLVVTGENLQWYDAATGGNSLADGTVLVDGATYFASQTVGGCESESRLEVTVTITATIAPTGSRTQTFCQSDNPTLANLAVSGSDLQWYDAPSDGNSLTDETLLVDGRTYYASQSVDECESGTRLAVTVILATAEAPTGSSSQTFCNSDRPTLNNLIVSGTDLQWYDASSEGNVLANGTALIGGEIYYASQVVNGCESESRLAVTAIITTTEAPLGSPSQTFCQSDFPTLANLNVSGSDLQWYDASSGGNVLVDGTALSDGTTYYASQTINGCESEARLAVIVIVDDCNGDFNNPPFADDGEFIIRDVETVEASLAVLTNDPDGDPLTYSLLSNPPVGVLTLNPDGSFTYVPEFGFEGVVRFAYEVCDNGNPPLCDSAIIEIVITGTVVPGDILTPDGDGTNDELQIEGITDYPNNKVTIYNRWGNLVAEYSGYNNEDVAFTGIPNRKGILNSGNRNLPDGTYYYVIILFDSAGNELNPIGAFVELKTGN